MNRRRLMMAGSVYHGPGKLWLIKNGHTQTDVTTGFTYEGSHTQYSDYLRLGTGNARGGMYVNNYDANILKHYGFLVIEYYTGGSSLSLYCGDKIARSDLATFSGGNIVKKSFDNLGNTFPGSQTSGHGIYLTTNKYTLAGIYNWYFALTSADI